MSALKWLDRIVFLTTIASSAGAAYAGFNNHPTGALYLGIAGAALPIVNRVVASRAMRRLAPRVLTAGQLAALRDACSVSSPFPVWVCHNREEAEPAALHQQIYTALSAGGLEVKWYGGMTNSTTGIEIAGPEGGEKSRLMSAFKQAGIPFTKIILTDDTKGRWGVSVWIGVHPGAVT